MGLTDTELFSLSLSLLSLPLLQFAMIDQLFPGLKILDHIDEAPKMVNMREDTYALFCLSCHCCTRCFSVT